MIKTGLLNPGVLSLLARVRHTNTIVIADRGFPHWPALETIDLSLIDNIPTVLQVLGALRANHDFEFAYMANEFVKENTARVQAEFQAAFHGIGLHHEAHDVLKQRVPGAIGVIRTGDTTQYANMVLISGRIEGAPKK